jgi:hypothetical protein
MSHIQSLGITADDARNLYKIFLVFVVPTKLTRFSAQEIQRDSFPQRDSPVGKMRNIGGSRTEELGKMGIQTVGQFISAFQSPSGSTILPTKFQSIARRFLEEEAEHEAWNFLLTLPQYVVRFLEYPEDERNPVTTD